MLIEGCEHSSLLRIFFAYHQLPVLDTQPVGTYSWQEVWYEEAGKNLDLDISLQSAALVKWVIQILFIRKKTKNKKTCISLSDR